MAMYNYFIIKCVYSSSTVDATQLLIKLCVCCRYPESWRGSHWGIFSLSSIQWKS